MAPSVPWLYRDLLDDSIHSTIMMVNPVRGSAPYPSIIGEDTKDGCPERGAWT